VGRVLLAVTSAAAVVVACGSEPKKEPATATAPATEASSPTTPAPEARAAAASPAPADTAPAAKPDRQAECDAFVDDANSALDAERIAVDKLCKKDADCMPIKGRACGFVCTTGAIPKSEEKEWNETLQKVRDGQCKAWNDNECAKLKTKPPPTCQDRKVWCDKGHCALKEK
jgi:hypothetical protein